jgi:hypothetical protein
MQKRPGLAPPADSENLKGPEGAQEAEGIRTMLFKDRANSIGLVYSNISSQSCPETQRNHLCA